MTGAMRSTNTLQKTRTLTRTSNPCKRNEAKRGKERRGTRQKGARKGGRRKRAKVEVIDARLASMFYRFKAVFFHHPLKGPCDGLLPHRRLHLKNRTKEPSFIWKKKKHMWVCESE
jgi:hypothetical protein